MTEHEKKQTAETFLNVFGILAKAGEVPDECDPLMPKQESDAEILARVKRQREIDKSKGISI